MSRTPSWIEKLPEHPPEEIQVVKNALLPFVQAALLAQRLRRKEREMVERMLPGDLCVRIDAPDYDPKRIPAWECVGPLELITGLRTKVLCRCLGLLRYSFHPEMREPETLAQIAHLTDGQRMALADALAKSFVQYWYRDRYDESKPEERKGAELEARGYFLNLTHWRIAHGEEKST